MAEPGRDLARLLRWQQAGGGWRLVARSDDRVTIALLRCDEGEEIERFTSTEDDLHRHLTGLRQAPR